MILAGEYLRQSFRINGNAMGMRTLFTSHQKNGGFRKRYSSVWQIVFSLLVLVACKTHSDGSESSANGM